MKQTIILAVPRSGHNFIENVLGSWAEHRLDVQGYENIMPARFHEKKVKKINHLQAQGKEVAVVVLIRDLLNWSASWLKYAINQKFIDNDAKVHLVLNRWLEIACEVFGDTNYIPDSIPLFYDQFVADDNYKLSICNLLNGTYTESVFNEVPNLGHGSSFDRLSYDGKGKDMPVLDRWKWFLTDQGAEHISKLAMHDAMLKYYMDKYDLPQEKITFINSILSPDD